MKKILSLFVLLLALGARAQTSSNQVYIVVTTTNVFGNTNINDSITVNGSTRRMTNDISSSPSTLIRGTNAINKASTNIYQHFKLYPPPGSGLDIIPTGTNTFTIQARYGDSITFSSAGKWGTITLKTNPTTYGVGLRMPIDTYAPTNRTNYASMMARALDLSTSAISSASLALTNFINSQAPQTFSNKTAVLQTNIGGFITNVEARNIQIVYHAGETNGSGINFGQHHLITGASGNAQLIQADGEPAEPSDPGDIITYYWGNLIYPQFGANNSWNGFNSFLGSNWFRGGFMATNANIVNLVVTNGSGTFNYLYTTNLNAASFSTLSAVISSGFGTFGTLTGTNFTAYGGYIGGVGAGSLFINLATISNAWSIGGNVGTLSGGIYSAPNVTSMNLSNSLWLGTNVNAGDISYPWYELNTIANGVNPAIPVGTNVNIRLSGNTLPATIIGIAGGRTGRELKFVNGSGAAITFSQSTSDPVVANRIVGNITDVTIQPGESISFSWIAADGKWRFFVPTSVSGHYTLYSQSTSGVATNITTVETSVLGNGSGSKTLAAGFWESNKMVHFFFDGAIWTGATPGKSYLTVKLGSTVVCSNLFTPTANLVGKPIFIRGTITCRTNSATGALLASGYIMTPNANTYEAFTNLLTVIDTTASMAFDLTATNGATSTSIGTDNGGLEKK